MKRKNEIGNPFRGPISFFYLGRFFFGYQLPLMSFTEPVTGFVVVKVVLR